MAVSVWAVSLAVSVRAVSVTVRLSKAFSETLGCIYGRVCEGVTVSVAVSVKE